MSRNCTGIYGQGSGSQAISDSQIPNQSATGSPDGQKREVGTAENPNFPRLGTSTVVPSASNPLRETRDRRTRKPYDGDRTNKVATLTSGKDSSSGAGASNETVETGWEQQNSQKLPDESPKRMRREVRGHEKGGPLPPDVSEESRDESMSSPEPSQQPQRLSRRKRKADRQEKRRSAKSKSSSGRRLDSGASSSSDSDNTSGSGSDEIPSKKLTLEDTLNQIPEDTSVGKFALTQEQQSGAIEAYVVVPGPKGSTSVGNTTQREVRDKDTIKMVYVEPGPGKAVGDVQMGHSKSSGATIVGVGPGAEQKALSLYQRVKEMAQATQPPEAATQTSRKKKSRKEKESKKGSSSISDALKDSATLTGMIHTVPAQEGSLTAVVSTGSVTTDGVVYKEGVTVENQTNVMMKINPGTTESANGMVVRNGAANFNDDLTVSMTDNENTEEFQKAFDHPFFRS